MVKLVNRSGRVYPFKLQFFNGDTKEYTLDVDQEIDIGKTPSTSLLLLKDFSSYIPLNTDFPIIINGDGALEYCENSLPAQCETSRKQLMIIIPSLIFFLILLFIIYRFIKLRSPNK